MIKFITAGESHGGTLTGIIEGPHIDPSLFALPLPPGRW